MTYLQISTWFQINHFFKYEAEGLIKAMLSTMSSQNVAQGKRPDSLRLDSCRFGMSLTEFNDRINSTACNERSYVIIQWHHNTYILCTQL